MEEELIDYRKLTPVGYRMHLYKRCCPPEFMFRIERERLANPEAFDQVKEWNGNYPGPMASGVTGTAKTRAAWHVLGRLSVREGKTFQWFTTKRFAELYFEYHMDGEPQRFWRVLQRFDILFIDDLDKFEFNNRNAPVLLEVYDWAYRNRRPLICTTNQDRDWWAEKMGTAFCRRMFEEVHFHVPFSK